VEGQNAAVSRVVVIGAGLGGLSAAARLAAAGHEVTVCEQSGAVGGKMGRHTQDGFTWDTGPSLLTMPAVFEELFAQTGAPLDSVIELEPVEPIARYRFPDGTVLEASTDIDAFCAQLDERLEPGSGDDWRGFLDHAGAIWAAVEGPFLRSPLRGAATLARQAVRVRDLITVGPHRSLRALGLRHLRDWRLRMHLDRYATYTGSDPRRAPAALAVIPYLEQTQGAWFVQGGLHCLVEAVAQRATERGARLRTHADVVAVAVSAGRVTGVRLADGESLPADIVVANADADHLYRDLLPRRHARSALRRLDAATPSLSGFALLLGLRGTTPASAHHTVLFGRHYDAEFDAIFGAHPRPVADPTIYVAAPGDPHLAPPGSEAWFVLVNAARHGPVDWDSPGLAAEYAEHIVSVLAARDVPITSRITSQAIITPADLQRRTRAAGGSIYGTSSNGPRSAFLRPGNVGAVPGLFLVGGSSHPGGGMPLVTLSAAIVADLIGPA
jgi:phytoene desaturase